MPVTGKRTTVSNFQPRLVKYNLKISYEQVIRWYGKREVSVTRNYSSKPKILNYLRASNCNSLEITVNLFKKKSLQAHYLIHSRWNIILFVVEKCCDVLYVQICNYIRFVLLILCIFWLLHFNKHLYKLINYGVVSKCLLKRHNLGSQCNIDILFLW